LCFDQIVKEPSKICISAHNLYSDTSPTSAESGVEKG
jgi:hypothetical protein